MDNNKGNRGDVHFLTLHQTSSNALTKSSPTSTKCDPRTAARKAAQLFGCYNRNEANDPEIFITAMTAMLACYPELVVDRVCDPIRGLPAKNRFLPAIAEIREACEREMIWHDAVERRDRERRHTAEVLAPPSDKPTAESRARVRQAADELLAELNARGEPRKIDFKPPRSPSEAEVARRHFEARLPELAAEYAATPPKLGPALQNYSAKNPDILGEAKREDCG
jgi:hypothetical protein